MKNKGKEKVVIAIITVVILLAIFLAFVISNSQKEPAKVTAQNDEKKSVETVRGGYTWKVFGKEMIADSVDLTTYDYLAANTLISKPLGTITFTTTDKFVVDSVHYNLLSSADITTIDYRVNEALNSFTVDVPSMEGTYIYTFNLKYAKGESMYGLKVVVTSDNVYDVAEIVDYTNTEITDGETIRTILQKLPYHDALGSVIVDDDSNSLKIRYNTTNTTKEELLNNTVALFVLMPELEIVSYEQNDGRGENDIFYSREEINHIYQRNILEYVNDTEGWSKEVIYKERPSKESKKVEQYEKIISEMISAHESEIKDKVLVVQFVPDEIGNIALNNYEKKSLLNQLSEQFESVICSNKENLIQSKNVIKIEELEKVEDNESIKITFTNQTGNSYEQTYLVVGEQGVMKLEDYQKMQEESAKMVSGEKVENTTTE